MVFHDGTNNFVLPAEALRDIQSGGQAVAKSKASMADMQYATSASNLVTHVLDVQDHMLHKHAGLLSAACQPCHLSSSSNRPSPHPHT